MAESGTWRTTADGRGEEAARACMFCHWIGFASGALCPGCMTPLLPGRLRTRQTSLAIDADLLDRVKALAQRALDEEGGHGTVVLSAELLLALVTRAVPVGDVADALRTFGRHASRCDGGACACGWAAWERLLAETTKRT